LRISVVIPCQGATDDVRRSVDSVEKQAIDGTEIILVEESSGVAAGLERGRSDAANLRLIKANGSANARDAGLMVATSEYVGVLDAGDAYGDGVFAKALAVLDTAPWIEAVDFPVRGGGRADETAANSLSSNLIVRRRLAQAIGFPDRDGAFRAMVRAWGNIRRIDDVFLEHEPRANSSEAAGRVSEYETRTAERIRRATGIQKTRVLHVSDSRNPAFEPFDFETFDTDTSFGHAKLAFQGRVYPPIPFVKTPARVLDIGANIGASAVTFALRYPRARIVAVEPAHQPFTLLRCNAARYANIECYNVGLFSTTMKRPLFVGVTDSLTNSIVPNRYASERRDEIQLVAADVFATEMEMTRPDIIKIDTEGCELPILSAMGESVRAAKVVYLEYHSEEDRIAIDEMLRPTHILYAGSVLFPHRGEFVYVLNDAFPTPVERDRWRIGA